MRRFLLIIIGLLFVSGINAYDFETNGLYYSINSDNKTVSVVKGDVKYQGDIVIPSSVRYNNMDYVVTSVSGFNNCYNVKSLSISHTVSKIEAYDFMNCSGLASIVVDNNNPVYDSRNGCNAIIETANNKLILGCQNTIIPNTVKILGDRAFCGCTGLTEITIPNSVVSLEEHVFTESHLTSITIPSNLTSIDLWAFYICNYLTNIVVEKGNPVYDARDNCNAIIETATNTLYIGCKNSTIPRTVETIGRFAFTQCSYLTSIDIPNNVKRIEEYAFQSCSLSSLYIPASVDSIEYGAFQNCDFTSIKVDTNNHKYDSRNNCNAIIESTTNSLILGCKNTVLLNSVISIGSRAFHGCKSLTSVTIPSSVTTIGSEAFSWCTNLTSVIIGENVTTIGSYAFEDCKVLNTITFPNRLTYLGDRSFNNTAWLDNQASGLVYVGNWAYIYKGEMPANTSVIIKSGTLGIANSAFRNCTGLVSVTFPNSLSIIGYWSFYGCSGLKDVISEIKDPFEIDSSVFSDIGSNATLTVPSGTKSKYQATKYWNKFPNIVEASGSPTATEVTFTSNQITYRGAVSSKTAEVKSVGNGVVNLEIPSSVSYNGTTYQVTSIADGVLSGRTFNYVSLPSTVKSISSSTFDNSKLGALIWNANASLSQSVFSNMAMPVSSNFLLYVNSASYAPSNVKNVVAGSVAQTIRLSDDGGQFYCPQSFTARSISYIHNYSMETGGSGMGWETIALPFNVQKVSHSPRGEIVPFASYSSGSSLKPFWLASMVSSGFRSSSSIQANTPYIIAMPNNSSYRNDYILAGDVTFSAENVSVPVTPTFSGFFVPAYSTIAKSASVYALNVRNRYVTNTGNYVAGSRFISNLRDVRPFEAYLSVGSSTRGVIEIGFSDGTTGMADVIGAFDADRPIDIYTLSGQKVAQTKQGEIDNILNQLPHGVYIVNGKKIVK